MWTFKMGLSLKYLFFLVLQKRNDCYSTTSPSLNHHLKWFVMMMSGQL